MSRMVRLRYANANMTPRGVDGMEKRVGQRPSSRRSDFHYRTRLGIKPDIAKNCDLTIFVKMVHRYRISRQRSVPVHVAGMQSA